MKFLVYLTIISAVSGQLVKVPLGSGNLYPLDLLVMATVSFWLLGKLLSDDDRFKWPSFSIFLFLFSFWALITLIKGSAEVNFPEFLAGFFYLVRFIFYSLFSLVIIDLTRRDSARLARLDETEARLAQGFGREKFKRNVIGILVATSGLVALAGFLQLIVYPDLNTLAREFGYDPHKNRLVSTFLDPNFTGAYLVLALILIFSLTLTFRYKLLVTLLLITGILLTFSRSAWLMTAAGLFLYGLLRSRRLLLVSFTIFFLAYFLVPRVQTRIAGATDPDDSAKLRLVSWSHAWEIFGQNPYLGVGFNLYRSAQERFGFFDYRDAAGGHAGAGSDSSLLLVLATTGLTGLVLFLLLWGKIFVLAFKRIESPIGLALTLSLFGLFFESQFINSLFFPQIMLWLWTLVGLLFSEKEIDNSYYSLK